MELFILAGEHLQIQLFLFDFGVVVQKRIADLVLEMLEFDILVKQPQQVFNLQLIGFLGQLRNLVNKMLRLLDYVLGNLQPERLLDLGVSSFLRIVLGHVYLLVGESNRDSFLIETHHAENLYQ